MPKNKVTSAYKASKNIYDDVLTGNKLWSRLYLRFFWGVDDIMITNELFARLPANLAGKLLDVPCGTMNLTAHRYACYPDSSITCLDYSPDMLAAANERIAHHNLRHVTAVQGDVGNLSFENDRFDVVLSMNGFHVFPDKGAAYRESARVLRQGGIFLGCFYVCGEYRRSDFVVSTVLAKRGWFTPPFQTKDEVEETLHQYYSQVQLFSKNAMVWFYCVK